MDEEVEKTLKVVDRQSYELQSGFGHLLESIAKAHAQKYAKLAHELHMQKEQQKRDYEGIHTQVLSIVHAQKRLCKGLVDANVVRREDMV